MADEDVADNWEDADTEVNGPPAVLFSPVPCVMLGNRVTAVKTYVAGFTLWSRYRHGTQVDLVHIVCRNSSVVWKRDSGNN